VLVARRRDRLDALAKALPTKAHVFPLDLSQPDAGISLVNAIEAEGLAIHTLINNAGFGLAGKFWAQPVERLSEMIDLNCRTLAELCHLVLPGMRARGKSAILNVASTAAFQAGPNMAVYYASKAFVLSFTEALHHELKGSGIRVSCLCPGPTESEFGEVAGSKSPALERIKGPAAPVVRAGLKGLDANKAIVVPGLPNKITAQVNRVMPRAAMRRIVGRIKVD
jgi:uncharacterized protein